MSISLKQTFVHVQSRLAETQLYSKKVDGLLGDGTFNALRDLLGIFPNTLNAGFVKQLQTSLNLKGFNAGHPDGVWGSNTSRALLDSIRHYQKSKGLPQYGYTWSKLVSKEFIDILVKYRDSKGLPFDAVDWMLSVMAFESGYTFDPTKRNNSGSKAYGLIQFMDSGADLIKIPLDVIRGMGQLEQLEKAVLPYFDARMRAYGKLRTLEDFYFAVLRPKSIGTPADSVLFRRPSTAYTQNIGFDKDLDGLILAGEVCQTIYDVYNNGLKTANRSMI